jgi:hypothetical protein
VHKSGDNGEWEKIVAIVRDMKHNLFEYELEINSNSGFHVGKVEGLGDRSYGFESFCLP